MGVVQNLIKRTGGAAVPPPPATTTYDGRERLRAASVALREGRDCVAELEARLARLTTIVSDAAAAHSALQDAVKADGGMALAAYSAGNAPDQPIAKLVAMKENTAKAASAAKDALPGVEVMLAKARAECDRLESVKFHAMIVHLKTRACDENAAYIRAYNALCASYERMCGISIALSATGHGEMMTTGVPVPIRAPGFNMGTGSAHGSSESVVMSHLAAEAKVGDSTAKWMQARERLLKDVDAELDDLIGPQFQYESDRDL